MAIGSSSDSVTGGGKNLFRSITDPVRVWFSS